MVSPWLPYYLHIKYFITAGASPRPTAMLPQNAPEYQEELEKFLEMWDTITNANITTSRRPSCPII